MTALQPTDTVVAVGPWRTYRAAERALSRASIEPYGGRRPVVRSRASAEWARIGIDRTEYVLALPAPAGDNPEETP